LESHRYNESRPSPKAYCFSKSVDKKPLLVSSPCLAPLIVLAYRSPQPGALLGSHPTSSCIALVLPLFTQLPYWSSCITDFEQVAYMVTVHLSSHVVMISHATSCIHFDILSKRISSPITLKIDSVGKFLPGWRMSPLTLGWEKILFPF
jgi:hypothetical protein